MSFADRREYKCELYGSQLTVVDRWFPSSKTCSRCGTESRVSVFIRTRAQMRTLQF
ncbi:zinc ribbon domain-containing protein [Okeania sp. SIO3B5]|uniref:zinc ribbon domain-containing protein n=1 Tax=Okeania sp. SIO3B5 TaxID=2607811 RepID=UPI0025FB2873|nr:zinc ribbon domain-containing protein [Okeania sp. SIO3B5]